MLLTTTPNPPQSSQQDENGPFEDVGLATSLDGVDTEGVDAWAKLDDMGVDGLQDGVMLGSFMSNDKDAKYADSAVACNPSIAVGKPFHKWMKTIHRRAVHRRIMEPTNGAPFPGPGDGFRLGRTFHSRKSSSGSSTAFVTAMKSASVSLAGTSFFARSRRNTARSSRGHSRADRSSAASIAHPRLSTDSTWAERPVALDQAVTERSLQRRRILEELIETEESYIGDVRFLMNVRVLAEAILRHL